MINIHCWEEEEPEDMQLEYVVDVLLTKYRGLTRDQDVRKHSREISEALKAAVAEKVAHHTLGAAELEDGNEKDAVQARAAGVTNMPRHDADKFGSFSTANSVNTSQRIEMVLPASE